MKGLRHATLQFAVLGFLVVMTWYSVSRLAVSFPLAGDFQIYARALSKANHGDNPYLPFEIGPSFLYHPASLFVVAPFAALGHWPWIVAGGLAFAAAVAVLRAAVGQPVCGPDQHPGAAGPGAGAAVVEPR
jgi:hypothetical protein